MPQLEIDGQSWHYQTDETAGSAAPPLVLLHGASANLRVWDTVVDALRPHFRLFRPDLFGHGLSAKPDDRSLYSIPRWAEGVRRLLDHWGLEQAILLGHSMGGMTALEFALTWPDRVTALGLLNTTPGPLFKAEEHLAQENAMLAYLASVGPDEFFTQGQKLNPFAVRHERLPGGAARVREQFLLNTVESYTNTRYAMRHKPRHTPRLGEITCPTAVFISEHDEQFQVAAEIMVAKIPNATRYVIPDAGHTPQLENPAATADILKLGMCALLERVMP